MHKIEKEASARKKNKTYDMEGLVHKKKNPKFVTKGGQVATNLQIMEPRKSNRKRISNTMVQDSVS